MKNGEQILELLAETLQRIDRHSVEIERLGQKIDRHSEQIERQQDELKDLRQASLILIAQIQKHQERLDRHGEAFGSVRERTEVMHQSALEQQKAYQAMTELIMHHNRALVARGII